MYTVYAHAHTQDTHHTHVHVHIVYTCIYTYTGYTGDTHTKTKPPENKSLIFSLLYAYTPPTPDADGCWLTPGVMHAAEERGTHRLLESLGSG